jgi:hypothetical protein
MRNLTFFTTTCHINHHHIHFIVLNNLFNLHSQPPTNFLAADEVNDLPQFHHHLDVNHHDLQLSRFGEMYRPNHDLDWNEWTLDLSDEYFVFMCPAWWRDADCDGGYGYDAWEDRPNANGEQFRRSVAGAG